MKNYNYSILGWLCLILSFFFHKGGFAQNFLTGMGIGFCLISIFKRTNGGQNENDEN